MTGVPKLIWVRPRIGPKNTILGWDNGMWSVKKPSLESQAAEFVRQSEADRLAEALQRMMLQWVEVMTVLGCGSDEIQAALAQYRAALDAYNEGKTSAN